MPAHGVTVSNSAVPQFIDPLGLSHTASSTTAIDSYMATLDAYLASKSDVMPRLETLIEADPGMPGALLFRAFLLKQAADPRLDPALTKLLSAIETRALNEREQQLLMALKSWLNNQLVSTAAHLETLLSHFPRDILAMKLAHHLHFYSGLAVELRDSIKRIQTHWHPDLPFYGYVLGMLSFGFEEAGDYGQAEQSGKAAVTINSHDLWATHAVTHVYQMQGRFQEGIEWIESIMPSWSNANNFIYHMHWHKALHHLGLGEHDRALSIYDTVLADSIQDDFYLDLCNNASLLWRLEMRGVDTGDRWQPILDISQPRAEDEELVFCTLHYLLAPARLNKTTTVDAAIDHFKRWAREDTTQGRVCQQIGLPVAYAIRDLGDDNNHRASQRLAEVADDLYQIGGSHAQRELFSQLQDHFK
jgi:tetratricopeptide (TPR) repeat protein